MHPRNITDSRYHHHHHRQRCCHCHFVALGSAVMSELRKRGRALDVFSGFNPEAEKCLAKAVGDFDWPLSCLIPLNFSHVKLALPPHNKVANHFITANGWSHRAVGSGCQGQMPRCRLNEEVPLFVAAMGYRVRVRLRLQKGNMRLGYRQPRHTTHVTDIFSCGRCGSAAFVAPVITSLTLRVESLERVCNVQGCRTLWNGHAGERQGEKKTGA